MATPAQKIAGGVVMAMVATAVLLPERQTVPVIKALGGGGTSIIEASEGMN
jgi:hypothetical protein